MNHDIHYGILIHTELPYTYRSAILDYKHGLCKIILPHAPSSHALYHGMLLEYTFENEKKRKIAACKLLALPQLWVTNDLEFFHAVLKIISQCLPEESINRPLYELLSLIYRYDISPDQQLREEHHQFFKLWFLCRLYMLLGVYPDNHSSFNCEFLQLLSSNKIVFENISPNLMPSFQQWLKSCDAHMLEHI